MVTTSKAAQKPAARIPKTQPASRSARALPRPRLPPPAPTANAGRPAIPEIIVGFDEEAVANEGIAALAACPELFVHDAQLVTLVPRAHPGLALASVVPTLRIKLLKLAAVVTRNTRRIRLYLASNWPSADIFEAAMRQLRSP